MDEFFHFLVTDPNAKKALITALWIIVALLVIISIFVIVVIIQERSLKIGPFSIGERSRKKGVKNTQIEEKNYETFILDLPSENDNDLEKIIEIVDAATEAESDRFWRMLNLLQGIHVFDNSALLKLCNQGNSPHEAWKKAAHKNTRFFRNVDKSLQIAMQAISTVTTGDDLDSIRRASIALIDKNNYLYIIARDHYSKSHEKEEKFYVGDTVGISGIAGYVAYTKQPIRVPNVLKDLKFIQFNNTPKYKSLLCVPIIVEESILGTFAIDSTAEDAYTQEEEQMAMVFANTIATSVIALMIKNKLQSK